MPRLENGYIVVTEEDLRRTEDEYGCPYVLADEVYLLYLQETARRKKEATGR